MKISIPLWVIASIGKRVELVKAFMGPVRTYHPMHQGVLVGIMYDEASQGSYALVALEEDDLSYMENFGYADIRPPLGGDVGFELKSGYVLPSDEGYVAPFAR